MKPANVEKLHTDIVV